MLRPRRPSGARSCRADLVQFGSIVYEHLSVFQHLDARGFKCGACRRPILEQKVRHTLAVDKQKPLRPRC